MTFPVSPYLLESEMTSPQFPLTLWPSSIQERRMNEEGQCGRKQEASMVKGQLDMEKGSLVEGRAKWWRSEEQS